MREQLARYVARPRGEDPGQKLDRLEAIEAKGAGRGATEVFGEEIPRRPVDHERMRLEASR